MNGRIISPVRIELLRLLISVEPTILAKVQSWDGSNKKTPKKVQVREDGQVYFYYGNGPLFWQRLFNDYETVSIVDVAIRIADAITGSGKTRNHEAFDSITKAILDEAVKNNDLDCVIDILFDNMRTSSNGELRSKYIDEKNIQKYAKKVGITGKIVDTDLYGYVGIEIRPGVVAPIKLGRIREVQ